MNGLVPTGIRRRDVFSTRWVFRSAITGQYVTRLYAWLHPTTTYKAPRIKKSR